MFSLPSRPPAPKGPQRPRASSHRSRSRETTRSWVNALPWKLTDLGQLPIMGARWAWVVEEGCGGLGVETGA